jgi:Histidine phosphatase superfamily (branch 2)
MYEFLRFAALVTTYADELQLNDTLTNKMCPNAGNADEQTHHWQSIFAQPIVHRLNQAAPGANLVDIDIPYLMSLCPFETVAKHTKSLFCNLFTQQEFEAFEYYGDLNKFYGFGYAFRTNFSLLPMHQLIEGYRYGQTLGRVQGVGYVNELLARLTGKPVQDHTQTNRTLDSSPATFPLDRSIYVDFSHDNTMVAIYAALGLFQQPKNLDPAHPDPDRTWMVSRMVPFSGRMVTEKVQCSGKTKQFVRILVNDAVQSLDFCGGKHGLCELDAFVHSQGYARSDGAGDFEKCFA